AATPILRRDAITVQNDVNQRIVPGITTLTNDVNAFPSSGLAGSVAIHTDFQNLISSVNHATTDTNSAGSLDDESGAAILNSLQAVPPSLSNLLGALGTEVSAWSAVPGGASLILGDLQSLNTASDNFADALTTNGPASISDQVAAIKTFIDNSFTYTEAAFS
ncbi:hypothetical protein BO79DRAFT_132064, partial [Aspergillus costaricaensis CBS 115574]